VTTLTQPTLGLAAAVADQLRRLWPEFPHLYAIEQRPAESVTGSDWVEIRAAVPAMLDRAARQLTTSSGVLAARTTTALAYAVLGRPGISLALARRVPDLDSMVLRLSADGLVEQAGVTGPTVALLADDPLVGRADAMAFTDLAALIDWTADRAIAILGPLLDDLHRRTRFGLVPMWNLAADSVLGPSTVVPLLVGPDQAGGRAVASALLDALVARGAPIRRRGTTQTVSIGRRTVAAPVRGSCCLLYREATGQRRGRPASQSVCASCPLLDPADRAARFVETMPLRGRA
jgi:hypothetical protein